MQLHTQQTYCGQIAGSSNSSPGLRVTHMQHVLPMQGKGVDAKWARAVRLHCVCSIKATLWLW